MNKLTKAGFAGLFLSLTAVLASCGGSSTSTTDTAAVTADVYPVTVGDLTLDAQPTSIISLSPSATEMLYAIGAGSQVVAVDEYSNFPAEAVALGTKLSGFEPNIEAISGYSPDLVIVSYDPGSLVEQLKTLNIPVFIAGAAMSLENVYEQIEQLGVLTGHSQAAIEVSKTLQTSIEDAVAAVKFSDPPLSYYYELDNTYYSVSSNTFVGQIFNLFGMRNIADNVESGNDYPQLSAEVIVSSDPDFIFLADTKCCAQDATTVAARDGWGGLKAVTANRVVELDDDVASRWGPRVLDLITAIRDAVAAANS
jgi:iron complex transport system substrate-binding protein